MVYMRDKFFFYEFLKMTVLVLYPIWCLRLFFILEVVFFIFLTLRTVPISMPMDRNNKLIIFMYG